jgi:hypothetical protein
VRFGHGTDLGTWQSIGLTVGPRNGDKGPSGIHLDSPRYGMKLNIASPAARTIKLKVACACLI